MHFTDKLTVINPATEQVMVTTRKLFDSIYKDKGFELADRATAKAAADAKTKPKTNGDARVKGEIGRHENASVQTGGAASVAAGLGLGGTQENLPATDAGSGVAAGQNNEDDANANESLISDERPSSGRDRGRTS